jgi:hypothetical protein
MTPKRQIDPAELSGIFSAPAWLRDLGFSAWLLVGVGAALVGAIFLLAQTQTIVMPVVTAAIVASVTVPIVDWLKRRGVPRGAGAVLVFLGIVLIGVGVGVIVMSGIASQADSLSGRLHAGADEIESWARGLGVASSTAADANQHASASVSAGFKALTGGLLGGVDKLASLAVFLSFAAISLFFMLKDAPTLGRFVERHLGVPVPVAHTVLGQVSVPCAATSSGSRSSLPGARCWSASGRCCWECLCRGRSRSSPSSAAMSPISAPGRRGRLRS